VVKLSDEGIADFEVLTDVLMEPFFTATFQAFLILRMRRELHGL